MTEVKWWLVSIFLQSTETEHVGWNYFLGQKFEKISHKFLAISGDSKHL